MTTLTDDQSKQSIVVKSQYADRVVALDLSFLVAAPLTIATVAVTSLTPATVPPLSVVVSGFSGSTVTLTIAGGLNGTSYGVGLTLTDNLATNFQTSVAIVVQDDISIRYQDHNPYAFQSLMDSLEVGGAAVGKAFFMLPAGLAQDAASGYVTWSLLDKTGVVYATGNAYDYQINATSSYTAIEAHAVVNAPSDITPSNQGDSYQVRWELNLAGKVDQYAFENLRIDSTFSVPVGAQDTVELIGDVGTLDIVLDKPWDTVSVDVFSSVGSVLVAPNLVIQKAHRVSSGWYYQAQIDTSTLQVSLDPYIISWKYRNSSGPAYRDTGQLFVVNASILRAIKSVEAMISKAKTTLLGFQDELFTVPVITTMLARGRDAFNGATGIFTSFTMTNADSYIREYWIRYSEVALLESQYLLEGEKAYNFAGSAISLDVDRTQYYQQLASDIKAALDADIKQIKQNLLKKGLSGGDGSVAGLGSRGSLGPVGITISPASPLGRYPYFVR